MRSCDREHPAHQGGVGDRAPLCFGRTLPLHQRWHVVVSGDLRIRSRALYGCLPKRHLAKGWFVAHPHRKLTAGRPTAPGNPPRNAVLARLQPHRGPRRAWVSQPQPGSERPSRNGLLLRRLGGRSGIRWLRSGSTLKWRRSPLLRSKDQADVGEETLEQSDNAPVITAEVVAQ